MSSIENGGPVKTASKGKVVKAFGNLLHVEFQGNIRQGEVAMVKIDGVSLKAEVIEMAGKRSQNPSF